MICSMSGVSRTKIPAANPANTAKTVSIVRRSALMNYHFSPCCIFINQLRDKIGVMFGNPETTTGGNALKFYASVRVDVRRTTQIKDGDEALGNRTKVKIVKNKMAPPFKKAEFDIVYGEGISKVGEIIDLGVEYDIIKKSGSWFSYGDSKLAQGREAVKQLLTDNVELCEEIETKIREALQNVQD